MDNQDQEFENFAGKNEAFDVKKLLGKVIGNR